jgi:toxin-antitoxin system PIN domain toxin
VILADVNVLVYAFRRETPDHKVSRQWLDSVILGGSRFGMSPLALAAVVRVTTNSRTFAQPSTIEEATGYCDDILGQPHCELVEPGERHWAIFKKLCVDARVTGPKVTDAWYAALAIEWGCDWISFDNDYARFPGLTWRKPS